MQLKLTININGIEHELTPTEVPDGATVSIDLWKRCDEECECVGKGFYQIGTATLDAMRDAYQDGLNDRERHIREKNRAGRDRGT